jgi:hypothetical protein
MPDLAYVSARSGRRAEAQKPLDELREMYWRGDVGDRHIAGNGNAYFIAQVYVGLGDSVRRPQNSS